MSGTGNPLQTLEQQRTPILLAEIGVWLHLLGKLSEEFIDYQTERKMPKPNGLVKGYVRGVFESSNPLSLQTNFFDLATDKSFWGQAVIDSLKQHIVGLINADEHISLGEIASYHRLSNYSQYKKSGNNNFYLAIAVAAHDTSSSEEKETSSPAPVNQGTLRDTFCCNSFGFESQPVIVNQSLKKARDDLVDYLFPKIKMLKDSFRFCIINNIIDESWWKREYVEIVEKFREAYEITLGDTQRPFNDVTLWSAATLAAAFFKSGLARMVIAGWNEPVRPKQNDPSKYETVLQWRILRVNLDVLSIISKGIKIGDILGYQRVIDEDLEALKHILEVKYCLGNEIYRDTTGIYFSFPDVDARGLGFWDELVKELREAIQNIEPEISPLIEISDPLNDFKDLTSQRQEGEKALQFPYTTDCISGKIRDAWQNRQKGSEICPICRLRPMNENRNGCGYCLRRRQKRAKDWIKSPRETIWLDEVADHNDRVVLLVGAFDLVDWLNGKFIGTMAKKTPSSGRVRRVWETTQEFINHSVFSNILADFPYHQGTPASSMRRQRLQFKIKPNPRVDQGSTCDLDIQGIRMSPVCIDESQGLFVTTCNLQIYHRLGGDMASIISYFNNKNVLLKKDEDKKWKDGFKIFQCELAWDAFQGYTPSIKIYDSPDQFMVLIPAYHALEIAEKIVQEYEIQFSKVRDRLPFHLGLIAFHRRTPFYSVMEAGKRLIKTFRVKRQTLTGVILENKEAQPELLCRHSQGRMGNRVRDIRFQIKNEPDSSPLNWLISYSTGDPSQEDRWHPYWRYSGSNPQRGIYSFDYSDGGQFVVHVKKLKNNGNVQDEIQIEASYLRLLFMESSGDRFYAGEELRTLDDIWRVQKLWLEIEEKIKSKKWSISKIYAVWEEVFERRKTFKDDLVWEPFAKTSLKNILGLSPVSEEGKEFLQAAKDGLLQLCFYWHLQVRKVFSKLREEEKE
jgi:hypothetical protein